MECDDERLKNVGASALWALVYNNQKAKVIMKNANVVPKLQEALSCGQEENISDKCAMDIQAVIQTVSE